MKKKERIQNLLTYGTTVVTMLIFIHEIIDWMLYV